jgi:hypothetical protein
MNKKTYDEIFDAKLKAAGHLMLEKLAQEAPSDEELSGFVFPSKKLDDKIKASLRKASAMRVAKKAARASVFVAAAMVMIIGVGIITIKHTQALPIKFKDIMLEKNADYVELSASEAIDNDEDFLARGMDFIGPKYMPDGFGLVDVHASSVTITNTYLSRDNNTIRIMKSKTAGSVAFDNEHSTHYETQIMGNKAVVFESEGINTVFYFSNNYYYEISGKYVDAQELIKIAEKLPN